MKSALSKNIKQLGESSLYSFYRRIKEMELKGIEVVSLLVGEPDAETPESIKKAAKKAINEGKTRYVPSNGSTDIRSFLADNYGAQPEEVVISHGAKAVLSAVLHALINPEDRVLLAAPYYPPFVGVIKSLGGQPQLVDTRNNEFELSLNLIKKFLSAKKHFPKIAIINTPNNPTGVEYEQEELAKVVGWLEENDVIVIADECYSCFSSDPNFTVRLFSKSAIAIDTVSKGYAMPGWRIGWGVMPKEIANAVKLFLDNHIGCPCSISERAALKALGETFIKPYHQQRKMLADWLDQENIPFTRTNGGIYLFPDFSAYTKKVGGSVKLAEIFLEDGVAITPGTAFGNFEGYMRISFCVPPTKLNTALEKMSATIKKI